MEYVFAAIGNAIFTLLAGWRISAKSKSRVEASQAEMAQAVIKTLHETESERDDAQARILKLESEFTDLHTEFIKLRDENVTLKHSLETQRIQHEAQIALLKTERDNALERLKESTKRLQKTDDLVAALQVRLESLTVSVTELQAETTRATATKDAFSELIKLVASNITVQYRAIEELNAPDADPISISLADKETI